uniref:Dolichyl-diphosphooligosaccharide-protein glycosyltransferase subunit TMEM258 n=1 Tax=Mus spicilegus TaxID=10103 RepID=A0A8C6I3V2_MUSSI
MELEAMSRYTSPVNPAVFPHLTVVLLAIGMFLTAWFFIYEVTSTKYTRDIYKELLISLVASLFMGFGVLFLLLWVGIYICGKPPPHSPLQDGADSCVLSGKQIICACAKGSSPLHVLCLPRDDNSAMGCSQSGSDTS